jgi:hypothetical protein
VVLQKFGVKISCEGCHYVAVDREGGFEVTVPVGTADAECVGTARLRCLVTPQSHEIELVAWEGTASMPAEAMESVRRRLSDALHFVAERRICGNHHICPAEVIRIVKEHAAR